MKLDYGWSGPADFRCWGPYLSFGTSAATEMRVTWQSKFHAVGCWVEYGTTPACETRVARESGPRTLHTVCLRDLAPDTRYYYKISRPEDIRADEAPVYSFTTGPPDGTPGAYDVCVVGDLHASRGSASALFASMDARVPTCRFVASAGDFVTHGGEEAAWNDFFYQYAPHAPALPFMNATGNHDTDHPETYAHFLHTFAYPFVDPAVGAFYHFVYGNAVFIMLDSDNAGQAVATQGVISDAQMEWLETTLERYARQDYWIFVVTHHQVYSTGDFGMMHIYDLAYRDLFDAHHVDAVFYGHDHHFEVFWTGRAEPWGGTHYCLVGNGSAGPDVKNRDPTRAPPPNYLWPGRTYMVDRDGILDGNRAGGIRNDALVERAHVYGVMEQGFTHLHLAGDTCTLRMWGVESQLYFHDEFQRTGCGKRYHPPRFRRPF